ncbi:MAG: HAD hydrolase family protein [Pseudomonadota bacterium]
MNGNRSDLLNKASAIRLAVFDVDGVMTNGQISYASDGTEIKHFHSHDGLGLKALMANGIAVAVITARDSTIVERRMGELGIEQVLQGRRDKSAALDEVIDTLGLRCDQIAYAGDDLVDWPAMGRVHLKLAPANAHPIIRARADYVCRQAGGDGAVREMCELILEGHGRLSDWLGSFGPDAHDNQEPGA